MKDTDKTLKWLERAKSSLQRSKIGSVDPYIFLEDLCYDAEQCAEKSLKAVFVFNGMTFPKTHDIGFLLDTLSENKISIPENIHLGRMLTQYAVETRYPGEYEPVTDDEYKEALKYAECIYGWASELIKKTSNRS
jgi:HEPN domain-containing protein